MLLLSPSSCSLAARRSTPSSSLPTLSRHQSHSSTPHDTSHVRHLQSPVPCPGRRGSGSDGLSFSHANMHHGARLRSFLWEEEKEADPLRARLDDMERAKGDSQLEADPTAELLYNLVDEDMRFINWLEREPEEKEMLEREVRSAVYSGVRLLLEPRSASSVSTAPPAKQFEPLLPASVVPGLKKRYDADAKSQPLVAQLGHRPLILLASIVPTLKNSYDADAMDQPVQQLCYALAQRASEPGVMHAEIGPLPGGVEVALSDWATLLRVLASAGVNCGDSRVQQVFSLALLEELPGLLQGVACNQSYTGIEVRTLDRMSTVIDACMAAEFKGSMQPFVCALACVLQRHAPGNTVWMNQHEHPWAWSNLMYACGKLAECASGKDKEWGESVSIIMHEGAAALTSSIPRKTPNVHELSCALLGLALSGWRDDDAIRDLVDAFVQRANEGAMYVSEGEVARVLMALATLGWYDEQILSKLEDYAVKSLKRFICEPIDVGRILMTLRTLGRDDSAAYEQLLQYFVESLHAWTLMSSQGNASAEWNERAAALFSEANTWGPGALTENMGVKLYVAHVEAARVGLPGGGLDAANGLQQAAAEQFKRSRL